MIIVDCDQNSPEWFAARRGIPTASRFHEIITPTGKFSTASRVYMYELLAEWLTGKEKENFVSQAMIDGFLLQPEAVEFYELQQNADVDAVGFCLSDDGRYGASPDGLVGEDGTLEIKCMLQHNHMETVISREMPSKYIPQVQGQLLVTGREWCDFVAYHKDIPGEVVRQPREPEYIAKLEIALGEFCDRLDEAKDGLRKRGFEPAKIDEPQTVENS